MNELKKKITDLYDQSFDVSGTIHMSVDELWSAAKAILESNTSAFCLMPEWMKEAMKLMFNRGPFKPAIQRRRSDFWIDCTWLSMDEFYAQGADEFAFRLSPDYVFEEDDPEIQPCPFCGRVATIAGVENVRIFCQGCLASGPSIKNVKHVAIDAWNSIRVLKEGQEVGDKFICEIANQLSEAIKK